eukprot:TRINITY_DN461_c0_g1_i3.p1 TRINITY_DN461_c0_g1~~TRINITY_DN461_c0_g1_i3.p1  ORF type:complete len:441 (-),score=61.58 TRINITY_DN461_c0_g1_i3:3940-5262(-)
MANSPAGRALRRLSPLLLAFNIVSFGLVSSAEPEPSMLQKLVYHWLHWGANWRHASHPSAPHPRDTSAHTSTSSAALPEPPPKYVTGAATANASLYANVPYTSIMMHRAEVDLISSYLTADDVYVEFGSGGSSLAFIPLVKHAYSIDHDCAISAALQNIMSERNIHPGEAPTRFLCVDIKPGFRGWGTISRFEHANYEQFREYVDLVDAIPEKRFDKVLIDGRARLACALKILPYLSDESVVFIHDFYTRVDHYSQVLQFYIEVARVLAYRNDDPTQGPIDEPQGLIVLRRKPDLILPLSTADIDAMYERIDWRSPYPQPLTSLFRRLVYNIVLFFDWSQWQRAYNPSHLLTLVAHDLLILAAIYGIASFALQNYRTHRKGSRSVLKATKRPRDRSPNSNRSGLGLEAARPNQNIKFMETESMKAANARRKRASAVALKV